MLLMFLLCKSMYILVSPIDLYLTYLLEITKHNMSSGKLFFIRKRYPYCSALVGSRNRFEHDFTIELK